MKLFSFTAAATMVVFLIGCASTSSNREPQQSVDIGSKTGASDVSKSYISYDCKSKVAHDVGLPNSTYVQMEGINLSIQNDENDLYYTGKRTSNSSRLAMGFKSLIQDGYVLISKSMLNGKNKASLIIFDEALDSVETQYSCIKL